MNTEFWKGRRVFVTGHTGFKGGWLTTWLLTLGAHVKGYALRPATSPSYFESCGLEHRMHSIIGDIREERLLASELKDFEPEIIFHLAAQPIVRRSYRQPLETFSVNVMGTANLLEAARYVSSVRAIIVVTSDKCYENDNSARPFREDDPLGGEDPYSASKACAELVARAYRKSFFSVPPQSIGVATVRAGNVIGGGDWAADRLVPDTIRALLSGKELIVRNPSSIRPWQHVIEPLRGYLCLAEGLCHQPQNYIGAWNFGPSDENSIPVAALVNLLIEIWGSGSWRCRPDNEKLHESNQLRLDSTRAQTLLGWTPLLTIYEALDATVKWYREARHLAPDALYDFSCNQLLAYAH